MIETLALLDREWIDRALVEQRFRFTQDRRVRLIGWAHNGVVTLWAAAAAG
jgi:hypothetical protein